MPYLISSLRSSSLRSLAALAVPAIMLGAACNATKSTPAAAVTPDTWATVDGRQITRQDVERAFHRITDPAQPLSTEEETTAKLNLLDSLITQDILIAKAATLKIEVAQSELDTAYSNAKANIPDEAFQQELAKRSLTMDDMREGLRHELLSQKVVDHELASKTAVTDQEINDFFAANKAQFNMPEESYHIAQIVVTPVREPQITNASGDDAQTPQQATAKIQMLMDRLKAGATFNDLAIGYSEDPESAPRGGDLGFVPVSRLKQAPPQLRDAILNKEPGTVNVVNLGGAYTLVLVAGHEQAGQRDLSTPGVKDQITQALKTRKEQLLHTAYLLNLRADAQVTNYLARKVLDTATAKP
ncbi:MAG: peptidylprolyl isomerase [Acidobacteriaceae bacterium]|jgi:peptidyl-prolyl cis-trans isomerase SurA|nr:peptidylprolyl isomerase [Acidobacteriaceae bacterium]